jgi:hypothetical protein
MVKIDHASVRDSNFVRKDFYIEPPVQGASVEEWQSWMRKDFNKAKAAKAAFTKSFAHSDPIDGGAGECATVKIGGVYRQVNSGVGVQGAGEEGASEQIAVVSASQERLVVLQGMEVTRHVRGGSRESKRERQRLSRQAKRAAK